jgi:hypothetical protein
LAVSEFVVFFMAVPLASLAPGVSDAFGHLSG